MNIQIIYRIVNRLKEINPDKVILFGSYAWGDPHGESDLDIIVVTNDDIMPKNYKEKMEIYLKVSTLLSELKKQTPIDLVVHTRLMYNKFLKLGSAFSKEILKKRKILYERDIS
jgi:predicted nucleotidyltransferase